MTLANFARAGINNKKVSLNCGRRGCKPSPAGLGDNLWTQAI